MMALVVAEFGTPQPIDCPRCRDGRALRTPILIIRPGGVDTSPWSIESCRECGYLAKSRKVSAE